MAQPTTQQEYDYWNQVYNQSKAGGGTSVGNGMGYIPESTMAQQARLSKYKEASAQRDKLWKQLQSEKSAAWAADPKNPEVQSQAAWDEAMKLLKRDGPYTPQVTQQLVNRQADQTAFAEGVNAEELRNSAAARGLAPNDPGIQAAMRQMQAQRQQSNVAFQGDIASQAAIQNFAATQPGYMAAAQANLNRQFGGNRTPAVQGGGGVTVTPAPAPRPQVAPANTAFSSTTRGGQGSLSPGGSQVAQRKPLTVAERNKLQEAWKASGGKGMGNPQASGPGTGYVTNGKMTINTRPVAPTSAANAPIYTTPAQQSSLQKSLNQGIQYTPGVATKIPLAFAPKDNPFK